MADYTVQAGDNLTKIAKAHNTTVEELARLNNIKDVNKILIGQELSLGHTQETETTQNVTTDDYTKAYETEPQASIGMDSFTRQQSEQKNENSPFLLCAAGGAAGSVAGGAAFLLAPKVLKVSKTAYTGVKNGTKKAYAKMKASAKSNAKAVRNFVAQKAKHAAKSAELHYAFGKDAVKKGASKVAQNTKAVAKNAAHKTKVAGRYTRFIGNTKLAPKLIKGAGRAAGPLAALYGLYEVKTAYDKGGAEAAVKQGIKTGGGLAGGWAGAKVGATIGTMFGGPVGTVVGGIIGGVAGYLVGEKLFS